MSDTIFAVLLGILQGITEFLPISSSGHLIIFSTLTQGKSISLTLNVGLHVGTLIAILIYFRKDWFAIFRAAFKVIRSPRDSSQDSRLIFALIVGTIPAGLIGVLFKDDIERHLHHPHATVLPLILVGIGLWWVDRSGKVQREWSSITWVDGLKVGLAQAVALIPGTSRSGVTMMCARWLGFSRQESARFSFLLGAPAMGGAALLDAKGIIQSITDPVFIIGCVVSFVVGYATIAFLLSILKKTGFFWFAVYRVVLGVAIYFVT